MDVNLFWRIFDTLILAGGLAYIFVKYGNPFFDKRKGDIESSIEQAKEYERKAREFYEEAKAELAEARKEIEFIRQEIIREAEAKKVLIIKEAKGSAGKIAENFLKQAESEIGRQRKMILEEALEASFKAVREAFEKELSPEDYKKINESFLKLQEEALVRQSNK